MKLRFTKMQGAGNDFVVLDATRAPLPLSPAQFRRLADRRFGVGCDQILIVESTEEPGIDFRYRIVNADGGEVEQCGNGARCFVRYVHEAGLSGKRRIRVRTAAGVIEPELLEDGRVDVDMGAPRFAPQQVPFDATGLHPRREGDALLYTLDIAGRAVEFAVLSIGNPHAVLDTRQFGTLSPEDDPVAELGPLLERHVRFAQRANIGFVQTLGPQHLRLRVHERGVGETLACGTGACAAVVAGVRRGRLSAGTGIRVDTRGGELSVRWAGGDLDAVHLSGPAERVYEGEIELPEIHD